MDRFFARPQDRTLAALADVGDNKLAYIHARIDSAFRGFRQARTVKEQADFLPHLKETSCRLLELIRQLEPYHPEYATMTRHNIPQNTEANDTPFHVPADVGGRGHQGRVGEAQNAPPGGFAGNEWPNRNPAEDNARPPSSGSGD